MLEQTPFDGFRNHLELETKVTVTLSSLIVQPLRISYNKRLMVTNLPNFIRECLYFYFFLETGPVWPRTYSVPKQGLKVLIFLSTPLECWGYRQCATTEFYAVLESDPGGFMRAKQALCLLNYIPGPNSTFVCVLRVGDLAVCSGLLLVSVSRVRASQVF